MRYHCFFCQKSVTSELPDEAVIRAVLVCPECIQRGEITFRYEEETRSPKEKAGA
jgi:DNA-directed RNA polymerase subunit RPC12/RpoP